MQPQRVCCGALPWLISLSLGRMTPQELSALFYRKLCPVCGFELWFEPWVGESAADEICPSCGIQFGYDDAGGGDVTGRLQIYSDWRRRWISAGMKWRSQRKQPTDWNPAEELERLQRNAA
jgi:hypothetical protein